MKKQAKQEVKWDSQSALPPFRSSRDISSSRIFELFRKPSRGLGFDSILVLTVAAVPGDHPQVQRTLKFSNIPQRKKSRGLKSGDLAGINPPLPIHLNDHPLYSAVNLDKQRVLIRECKFLRTKECCKKEQSSFLWNHCSLRLFYVFWTFVRHVFQHPVYPRIPFYTL